MKKAPVVQAHQAAPSGFQKQPADGGANDGHAAGAYANDGHAAGAYARGAEQARVTRETSIFVKVCF